MMYEWAFILFFFTSIAAIFAFTGVAVGFMVVARIVFIILLALTLMVLFSAFFQKKKTNLKRLQIDIK